MARTDRGKNGTMPAMTPSATRSARMALAAETAVTTTSRSAMPA